MATKKEIDEHLKIALVEVGKITPWFDKEVGEWVFSHSSYPVEYGGSSKREVIENYPKYLREFIRHRLNHKIDSLVEKKTSGRGGLRPGAGRPKGTKTTNEDTKTVRVKIRVAVWIKKHEKEIEDIIAGEKRIVSAKPSHVNHHAGTRR